MKEQQAVLAINEAFYEAFEALDPDAMRQIWSGSADDVCIHPGWDLLIGWEGIRESWVAIFANTGYMRFRPSEVSLEIVGDMARVTCIENIFSVVEGHTIHSRVACTNLFQRRSEHKDEWRMVLHHASPIASAQSVQVASTEPDDIH